MPKTRKATTGATAPAATAILGDGEGENAQWLDPKPRNFTLGIFKCRSTPTGTLPPDSDLFDTIGRGLDSSNMPSWNPLSAQERADLVAYVKHFSARLVTEKPGTPIEIPPGAGGHRRPHQGGAGRIPEEWSAGSVTAQREANGPSAATLTTIRTAPLRPYNFTTEPASSAALPTKTLPDFHDRTGWHADAFVCRQHQAR